MPTGLSIEQKGTERAYFAYDGEPLLSFGGLSDFLFHADRNAYDYELWVDWAADHGMNHVRTYPPNGWKSVDNFVTENGGDVDTVEYPYEEVEPGSREFDLTVFNEDYWEQFREKCRYLEEHDVVVHLLLINGWELKSNYEWRWPGHFCNPENNVNGVGDHLPSDPFAYYFALEDGYDELFEVQKRWVRKLVSETAPFGNVYYDLVHEMHPLVRWSEDRQSAVWEKITPWIDELASVVRETVADTADERECVLGMDTSEMTEFQRDWVFSRDYFDVLVYGKVHTVSQAKDWRSEYEKPYIGQESFDDSRDKYSIREPNHRVHIRKYLWKFVLAKCQQLDLYVKPRSAGQSPNVGVTNPPGNPHNYDPRGWNEFETDALVLREFWDSVVGYPNLWFDGELQDGPVAATSGSSPHQYVLSSPQEAIAYVSSDTADEDVDFPDAEWVLSDLVTSDETYRGDVVDPARGVIDSRTVDVRSGNTRIHLPSFTDDLAIHVYAD
jgi:hypothetical protein